MSRDEETMNCEDYRQAIAGNPALEDDTGHVAGCKPCAAFRDEILTLDGRLKAAMEIDVPELSMPELPAIETDNVATLPTRRLAAMPATWFAVAATVLLGVFVGLKIDDFGTSYDSLAEEVLAHMDHEPGATRVTNIPVSERRLMKVVSSDVATMKEDIGLITYAQSCVINGKTVPHLVVQGENGPITILLMPDETIQDAKELKGVGVEGVILPVGNGSIAIIGEREEHLEEATEKILNSVTWST